jgi:hypothetical protein
MSASSPVDHRWVFDLIEPCAQRRRTALDRHRELLRAGRAVRDRCNALAVEATRRAEPRLIAALDQARAEYDGIHQQTIFGPLGAFLEPPTDDPLDGDPARYAAYALLFLRWERHYPDEWREAGTLTWSPWTRKELVLKRFSDLGVSAGQQRDLADLLLGVVAGPYRCKDWWYAALARHVAGPRLRHGLALLRRGPDPLPRLRAEFLLDVLDQPTVRITRTTWRRWLAARP